MITTDLDLTGLNLLCGLDTRLAALNRELQFIARTLARLRHRHHAVLVFSPPSSKQRSSHQALQSLQQQQTLASRRQTSGTSSGELQLDLQMHATEMLKRLFLSPRKERFEDLESAPQTPGDEEGEEVPPACLTPGLSRVEEGRRAGVGQSQPALELDVSVQPVRRRPVAASRPMSYGGSLTAPPWDHSRRPASFPNFTDLDTATVIVDQRSQAIFETPRKYIVHLTNAKQPETVSIPANRNCEDGQSCEGLYLPHVTVADFSDFLNWTRTGRILQHPPSAAEQEWYAEHYSRRLVSALALAHQQLKSREYEQAAMTELHALGPLLQWPEDLVNSVFAATSAAVPDDSSAAAAMLQHPARRLMVAIVAAKTCGAGKRKVRVGPRDKGLERDERIRSGTFWKMFDAYCLEKGGDCAYPRGAELYVAQG